VKAKARKNIAMGIILKCNPCQKQRKRKKEEDAV